MSKEECQCGGCKMKRKDMSDPWTTDFCTNSKSDCGRYHGPQYYMFGFCENCDKEDRHIEDQS